MPQTCQSPSSGRRCWCCRRERGFQAELVHYELADLTDITRVAWPALLQLDPPPECRLPGAGGPAMESRMHKEALWLFKDYRRRRLVSFIEHGVRLDNTMS